MLRPKYFWILVLVGQGLFSAFLCGQIDVPPVLLKPNSPKKISNKELERLQDAVFWVEKPGKRALGFWVTQQDRTAFFVMPTLFWSRSDLEREKPAEALKITLKTGVLNESGIRIEWWSPDADFVIGSCRLAADEKVVTIPLTTFPDALGSVPAWLLNPMESAPTIQLGDAKRDGLNQVNGFAVTTPFSDEWLGAPVLSEQGWLIGFLSRLDQPNTQIIVPAPKIESAFNGGAVGIKFDGFKPVAKGRELTFRVLIFSPARVSKVFVQAQDTAPFSERITETGNSAWKQLTFVVPDSLKPDLKIWFTRSDDWRPHYLAPFTANWSKVEGDLAKQPDTNESVKAWTYTHYQTQGANTKHFSLPYAANAIVPLLGGQKLLLKQRERPGLCLFDCPTWTIEKVWLTSSKLLHAHGGNVLLLYETGSDELLSYNLNQQGPVRKISTQPKPPGEVVALCMGFGQTDHLLVIIQENQQRLYRLDLNSGAWQEVEQTKLGLLYAQNFWPMDAQGTRLMFSNTKKGFVVDGALKVESNQKQGQITALTETGFYALSTGALFDLKDNLLFESRDNLLVPGPNGKAFLLLQNTGTHFDKRFAPFVLSLPEKRKVAKFPFEVAASELLQAFYFDDLGEYFYFLDHSGFLLRAEKVPGRN